MSANSRINCQCRARFLSCECVHKRYRALFNLPFEDLLDRVAAGRTHKPEWDCVQLNAALSIKTGGCPEDCAFCPQSAHYNTFVHREPMLDVAQVLPVAQQAYNEGAIEFCLGCAWRRVPTGRHFDRILEIIHAVKSIGLDVCCSMGTVSYEQAVQLKSAGASHFNHNLDTSPEYYKQVISTRPYSERLIPSKIFKRRVWAYLVGELLVWGSRSSIACGCCKRFRI